MILLQRVALLTVTTRLTSITRSASSFRKVRMPPKKKVEEVKKIVLGRPSNNLKVRSA